MKISRRLVHEGQRIPNWYGISYEEFDTCALVCYPLGLHLFPRLLRRFREWTLSYNASSLEEKIQSIRKEGFKNGLAVGLSEGFDKGRMSVLNILMN